MPEPVLPVGAVLAFPDRRQDGSFPVRGVDGRVVARLSPRWTGSSFQAVDVAGAPLCAGSRLGWGLSGRWQVSGADGSALMSVSKGWWRPEARAALARGGDYVLRGSAWRRRFVVTDVAGSPVLTALPRTSALSMHPYDFAVEVNATGWSLAEVVGLVQTWRMARKSDDTAAAGSVAATVTTMG
ncbi:MAG: hypothetical protein M3N21_01300 [Actinomycetota bacterium]|nr:hypothetical protein [Actinomycetota bacterium]